MWNLVHNLFQKRQCRTASVEELRATIAHPPPQTFFIDIRRNDEWDAGHISGFRHIPFSELENHLEELKHSEQVYFLCRSGGRSERACHMLEDAGYTGAINVLGGISEWIARGYPVER